MSDSNPEEVHIIVDEREETITFSYSPEHLAALQIALGYMGTQPIVEYINNETAALTEEKTSRPTLTRADLENAAIDLGHDPRKHQGAHAHTALLSLHFNAMHWAHKMPGLSSFDGFKIDFLKGLVADDGFNKMVVLSAIEEMIKTGRLIHVRNIGPQNEQIIRHAVKMYHEQHDQADTEQP